MITLFENKPPIIMKSRPKNITSKIMSAIPSKNTKPEILLGKAMWEKGLRYRKHYPIAGKPDFVFVRKKIAIFCDGDYWHGNNWSLRGFNNLEDELATYSEYWKKKCYFVKVKHLQKGFLIIF